MAELGLSGEIVELAASARTAADAAGAVGCDVSQIAKSMIFDVGGQLELALTSGAKSVDPELLAALTGGGEAKRADPDRVRAETGFAIGGVSPFGHLRPIRCWIDPHLLDHDTVWVAAGSPNTVFEVPTDRLADTTGGTVADFTA